MYWTELMSKILQSEMAQKIVNEVSPVYSDAYVALWMFESIGEALENMENWTAEYKNQLVPQTATWSLPMWEERYGLVADSSLSYEQRRQRIILRRSSGHTAMNNTRLAKIAASAAGINSARIEEHTGSNKFTIYLSGIPNLINEDKVRSAVDKAKQAHMIYDIEYEETAGISQLYTGGFIQTYKEITLTQL